MIPINECIHGGKLDQYCSSCELRILNQLRTLEHKKADSLIFEQPKWGFALDMIERGVAPMLMETKGREIAMRDDKN
tara:strand:- start:438 stop:668 length:231 start_codon:yes stop_codon:yes gene_type:complete